MRALPYSGLSPSERGLLAAMNAKTLIAFRLTVAFDGKKAENISLLATDACHAISQGIEIMFPDFDAEKPRTGMSIMAAPINECIWRPA